MEFDSETNYGFTEYDEEFDSTSDMDSEETSEVTSELSSEYSSEVQVIPVETIDQISDLHTIGFMGLAMFGTMFFLWVFDFVYKKLSHLF